MSYIVARRLNPITNKIRWAVEHTPSGTLYFPKACGKTYAVRLRDKLKKGNDMTDAEIICNIKRMGTSELLQYILDNPETLTDSYYREFGAAIMARAKELLNDQ